MLNDFVELSEILTGRTKLSNALAQAYMERVAGQPGAELDHVLEIFRTCVRSSDDPSAAVKSTLLEDPKLAPTVKQIILIWFTACTADPDGNVTLGTADQYAGALAWPAIGANVPGFSSSKYGYWRDMPKLGQ